MKDRKVSWFDGGTLGIGAMKEVQAQGGNPLNLLNNPVGSAQNLSDRYFGWRPDGRGSGWKFAMKQQWEPFAKAQIIKRVAIGVGKAIAPKTTAKVLRWKVGGRKVL